MYVYIKYFLKQISACISQFGFITSASRALYVHKFLLCISFQIKAAGLIGTKSSILPFCD